MSDPDVRAGRFAATAILVLGTASCSPDPAPEAQRATLEAEGTVTTLSEHPDYPLIKAYKDANAARLMSVYGAHALGIRWKTRDGERTDRPALVLYVDPAGAGASAESIPPWLEYRPTPDQPPVRIPTEVIGSERASPE